MRCAAIISLLWFTACSEKHYHWVEVPYCRVDEGLAAGHFETALRVLTKHDDGGGIQTLHGMRPIGDVVFDAPVLVAVVACDSPSSGPSDINAMLAAFDETSVPSVCSGQRTLVGPVVVSPVPSSEPGYDGALRFPTVPESELTCAAGAVARGADVVRR